MVGGRGDASRRARGSVGVAWACARSVIMTALLFLAVRAFAVEAFKIPTGSMEETLLVGDYLLVNKAVYGAEVPFLGLRLPAWREPARGEVVVFHPPHEPLKNYVKRVVGVPGDTLEMRGKTLLLNGREIQEKYARHNSRSGDATRSDMRWQRNHLLTRAIGPALLFGESGGGLNGGRGSARDDEYRPSRDNWGPILVPEGSYFVLGDNRDYSEDSRYWGFVDRRSIRGQPWLLYFSYNLSTKQGVPWLETVRWERVGQVIR
jgi:signal peptidase I